MKKRILLVAGLIGILLVSALAFTGCGEPEGTVTVTNATTLTEFKTLIVIIKEGSEEIARQDVSQNASVSFTLPVGDYTLQVNNYLFSSVSKSIPVYNKSDRKYRITEFLGTLIIP
jgi:hypothetical protein